MALSCCASARPIISLPLKPYFPKFSKLSVSLHQRMSCSKASTNGDLFPSSKQRKLPVLLFDVMDTIVRDPFYEDIPAFFGYTSDLPLFRFVYGGFGMIAVGAVIWFVEIRDFERSEDNFGLIY